MNGKCWVGKKVLITYASGKRKITTIKGVTPGGFLRIDGSLWRTDGSLRGSSGFHQSKFKVITEEQEKVYKKVFRVNNIKRLILEELPTKINDINEDELFVIAEILGLVK